MSRRSPSVLYCILTLIAMQGHQIKQNENNVPWVVHNQNILIIIYDNSAIEPYNISLESLHGDYHVVSVLYNGGFLHDTVHC